jgi:RimJ/RimL family protein N-acetyltransferase
VTLEIRPATWADTPTLFAFQADPVASAMAAFPSRDRAAFEAHTQRILADPSVLLYAIELDGTLIGSAVSWDAEGEREVGYWLGREHWGSGFATEALRAFLEVDRARPLFAYVAVQNPASQRVLRKSGFVEVRRERSRGVEEVVFRLDEVT